MRQASLAGLLAALTASPLLAQDRQAPLDFQGRALVAVSDADMLASAYVDGRLGPAEGADALSVIRLDGSRPLAAGSAAVSNSVAGPPSAVAASPDGRYAFTVETFGPRAPNGSDFDDLAKGSKLTVVDLAEGGPKVAQTIEIGRRPTSVAVSPDGALVAVAFHPDDGRQLALVPFRDGRLGAPAYVGTPGIPKELEAPHVDWHPSGRHLAVTVLGRNEVAFFAVEREPALAVRPFGQPVQVGKYPMMGRFTPDGRHFVNVNLYWGDDVAGFWVTAPRGDVTVTRFDAEPEGEPEHSLVSRAETGVSPEGISISPDGRFVVTANLERSYLPYDDGRITWYASLTLLRLDPETGRLTSHGESHFPGILPESAVFDASGRYVAATVFDHFDDARPGGSIDVWRVVDDPTSNGPRLVKTGTSIAVPRGPHSMLLVR